MNFDAVLLAALTPLAAGLVQALKGLLSEAAQPRWTPILSIGIGITVAAIHTLGWGEAGVALSTSIARIAALGATVGLTACGLYSNLSAPVKKKEL